MAQMKQRFSRTTVPRGPCDGFLKLLCQIVDSGIDKRNCTREPSSRSREPVLSCFAVVQDISLRIRTAPIRKFECHHKVFRRLWVRPGVKLHLGQVCSCDYSEGWQALPVQKDRSSFRRHTFKLISLQSIHQAVVVTPFEILRRFNWRWTTQWLTNARSSVSTASYCS
jgi:hypothetical protein